jgi:hypothetical protein
MRSATGSRLQRAPTSQCTAGRRAALRLLLKAWNMARAIRRLPWSLAVELEAFVAEHIRPSDLHWLVSRGYAEHRVETTRLGSSRRNFRTTGPAFTVRSCFVLTERGIQAARQHGAVNDGPDGRRATSYRKGRATRAKPRWDSQLRQLWLGKDLVKWFRVPAGNQEAILAAFQEEGWPSQIDDPLPPRPGMDPKERLHAAIRRLNGSQKRKLIRFRGAGTGMGVCWERTNG